MKLISIHLNVQADTPPQTPPALKLASMQLLHTESGAYGGAHEAHESSGEPKIISYRSQVEQIGQSGNSSPPTQCE